MVDQTPSNKPKTKEEILEEIERIIRELNERVSNTQEGNLAGRQLAGLYLKQSVMTSFLYEVPVTWADTPKFLDKLRTDPLLDVVTALLLELNTSPEYTAGVRNGFQNAVNEIVEMS